MHGLFSGKVFVKPWVYLCAYAGAVLLLWMLSPALMQLPFLINGHEEAHLAVYEEKGIPAYRASYTSVHVERMVPEGALAGYEWEFDMWRDLLRLMLWMSPVLLIYVNMSPLSLMMYWIPAFGTLRSYDDLMVSGWSTERGDLWQFYSLFEEGIHDPYAKAMLTEALVPYNATLAISITLSLGFLGYWMHLHRYDGKMDLLGSQTYEPRPRFQNT